MSVKFSRSTSFFSVDATQSLDKLLQKTRRYKTKFVVVNVDRGFDDASFYLAEHKHFVDAITRLKARVKELKGASQIAGDITLQDLLDAQKDAPEKVETTSDPVTGLSERTRSAIEGGNVVVHFRKDKPASILLPSKIAFNKLSSRGWLNLNQLTGFQYIDVSDPGGIGGEAGGLGGGPLVGDKEGTEGGEQAGGTELDETRVVGEKEDESQDEIRAEPSPGGAPASAGAEPPSKASGHAPETAKGNGGETQPPLGGNGGGNSGGSGGTGVAPDDWPAYPEIELSEEHPVQSTTINVEVRIKFEKPAKTVGTIKLPRDNKQYVLDAHLLLARNPAGPNSSFNVQRAQSKQRFLRT